MTTRKHPAKSWRDPEPMTARDVAICGLIGLGLLIVVLPVLGLVFVWVN